MNSITEFVKGGGKDITGDIAGNINDLAKDRTFLNIQCVTNSNSPAGIFTQLITLTKQVVITVLIIVSIIFIIGCLAFIIGGKNSFEEYWKYNLEVIKTILKGTNDLVDGVSEKIN